MQQSTIPLDVLTKNCQKSQHLISVSSIEDDALGETIQVIWEIEPDAHINEKSGLPEPTGFDFPIYHRHTDELEQLASLFHEAHP